MAIACADGPTVKLADLRTAAQITRDSLGVGYEIPEKLHDVALIHVQARHNGFQQQWIFAEQCFATCRGRQTGDERAIAREAIVACEFTAHAGNMQFKHACLLDQVQR